MHAAADVKAIAFPTLSDEEMGVVCAKGERLTFKNGDTIIRAGTSEVDFYVVERGQIDILNPRESNRVVASHGPHQFSGDIDLLTQRAVIFSAVAKGETEVTRVKSKDFRDLLGLLPKLGEKLLEALATRREMIGTNNLFGLRVVGAAHCAETTLVREFLSKNFVPYRWSDSEQDEGKQVLRELNREKGKKPVVECPSGDILERPSLTDLAKCAGVVRPCPDKVYDLAIVGSGPAGMAAAVYAASEGLSTVVLDKLGPGGQAGASSLIENFIGFPSGLSGTELATRAVLQMLKFGVLLIVPAEVDRVETGPEVHKLHLKEGEVVSARVILAATGAKWRKLEVQQADRWEHNGLYYSATSVEQRLCTGKPVAIVGAGNSGGQAAMYLSECSPKVYFVAHGDALSKGMSNYLVKRIEANKKIEILPHAEVTAVKGEDAALQSMEVTDRTTGEKRQLDVSAVFVFIGAEPRTDWLPKDIARDHDGYLITGHKHPDWDEPRDPCVLETSIPRILAAGDLRSGSTKRVGFAVGDGSMAVTCVHRLIG